MDQFLRDKDRDTVVVVNTVAPRTLEVFKDSIDELAEILDREIKVLVVVEKRDKHALKQRKTYPKDWKTVVVNTKSVMQLERELLSYLENVLLVVCHSEKAIPFFKNVIPHVPYLETPTMESLAWSEDKINMRRRLRSYKKRISPAYTIVENTSEAAIRKIKRKVGFPAIVKPAGLAASALVRVVYHEEELIKVLKKSLRKMRSVYRDKGYLKPPKMLIEQFMVGEMYSTDIYVNARGTMYTTPLVHIQTGFSAGYGDFFGYRQMTPVLMKPYKHQAGFDVAKESVIAMGLRSITAHVELMKTPDGWKVVEVNPRVGGFREFLYQNSFGIKHTLNDMLIRLPMRPAIPRKSKGYSVVMKMYPREQGTLVRIKGIQKMRDLESYRKHDVNRKKDQMVLFARNGGSSVVDIYMFNEKRSKLLADIHRLEGLLHIEVDPTKKTLTQSVTKIIDKTAEGLGIKPQG